MPQELQIKALLLDSNSLNQETRQTLVNSPHNFINRQVLISYQEFPNKDQQGVFFKVKEIQIT